MILQIDTENNIIVHKWYSLELIKQHTSYSIDKIKTSIREQKPYGHYIWIEYGKKQ